VDHLGPLAFPPSEVSRTAFDPPLLHTQISKCPERSDMKAILLPSGEYAGQNSLRVDGINWDGTAGV
jgi:hypothetical protein